MCIQEKHYADSNSYLQDLFYNILYCKNGMVKNFFFANINTPAFIYKMYNNKYKQYLVNEAKPPK